MNPRNLIFAPLALPTVFPSATQAAPDSQRYDTSFQVYQEEDKRMRIESFYLRGDVEVNAENAFRFQYLRDSISGASPTGYPEDVYQNHLSEIVPDVREGIMAALSHQFGDHRVEFEASRSIESDYRSTGLALSDKWDLNQKNTTLAFGINSLTDDVNVSDHTDDKIGLDLFTGLTQVIDRNTIASANLTLGYNRGYLSDPYKGIYRNEFFSIPGDPTLYPQPGYYSENRPDERYREVLQLQGTHFFEPVKGALDSVIRLSHDDYGIFSQTLQVEWRQSIGDKLEFTPFVRYYHQNSADFFANTLDHTVPWPADVVTADGSAPYYSADYRLSALESFSVGWRARCQLSDNLSLNISYERYTMSGVGEDASPDFAYPSADIWTVGFGSKF